MFQGLLWNILLSCFVFQQCIALDNKNTINVSLSANWNKTPFKLNVIESACSENEAVYEKLVLKLLNIEIDDDTEYNFKDQSDEISDSEFYNYAIELFKDDDIRKSLVDIKLSNKLYSPRIQSQYQYYNNTIRPTNKCSQDVLFIENDNVYCKHDDVFALKSINDPMVINDIKLPFDRIIGSSFTNKFYIVYGDYKNKDFQLMFFNLYQFAKSGKFNLIWRYVPDYNINESEILTGYGVELNLKRTDYIAIDDRGFSEEQQKKLIFNSDVNDDVKTGVNEVENDSALQFWEDYYYPDIKKISKNDLKGLGLKYTDFILNFGNSANDKFSSLLKTLSEFPKFAHKILNRNYNEEILKKISIDSIDSMKNEIPNGLYINDALIPEIKVDLFEILKTIKRELNFVKLFEKLDFDIETTKKIISKFASDVYQYIKDPSRRYNYSAYSDVIIYLNDLENDIQYDNLIPTREAYSTEPTQGQLPPAAENIFELIFVIDITDPLQLHYTLELISGTLESKLPTRIGIVPLTKSGKYSDRACDQFYSAFKEGGANNAFHYLQLLNRFVSSKEKLSLMSFRALDFEYLSANDKSDIFNKNGQFLEDFQLNPLKPVIISNGIFYPFEELNFAIQQISYDMLYLYSSFQSGLIPENINFKDFLRRESISSRLPKIIPDEIVDIRESFIELPDMKDYQQWNKLNNLNIFSELSENDDQPFITFNLFGSFLNDKFITQLIEALKFLQTVKNVRLVIIDISSTAEFNNFKDLPDIESRINYLTKLKYAKKANVDNSFSIRLFLNRLFKLDDNGNDLITLVINGRKINISRNLILDRQFKTVYDFENSLRFKTINRIIDFRNKNNNLSNNLSDKFSNNFEYFEYISWLISITYFHKDTEYFLSNSVPRMDISKLPKSLTINSDKGDSAKYIDIALIIDPISEEAQKLISFLPIINNLSFVNLSIVLRPKTELNDELPIKRFYKGNYLIDPLTNKTNIVFENVPEKTLFNIGIDDPQRWLVTTKSANTDLDNIKLDLIEDQKVESTFELKNILIEGYAFEFNNNDLPPVGVPMELRSKDNLETMSDTNIMANFGYLQLKSNPGLWNLKIKENTRGSEIFEMINYNNEICIMNLDGLVIRPAFKRRSGMQHKELIDMDDSMEDETDVNNNNNFGWFESLKELLHINTIKKPQSDINIFTVASGHLYERFLGIMTASVMKNTEHSVKFWFIENYMSPDLKENLPKLAEKYSFKYELIMYKWPLWLRKQRERQRTIWAYKILFLDVLFPQDLDKVIFVDADQIIRTDLFELMELDLHGAAYGYTPMCDSRVEMEGFRFWKQGYWKNLLGDKFNYHISALYVIDLIKFRKIAAGDRLRHHYQQLSVDPNSLSNLDQDLPNNLQHVIKIHSLPQEWLWCETWCSDESLSRAKTIDLCNNPLTKEPKLQRARRQIPEWVELDEEVAACINNKTIEIDLKHDEL